MKKLLFSFVLTLCSIALHAQTKIGHVNSQKLLDTLPSRKEALTKLKEFETNGMKELKEMEDDLNTAVAKYEKDSPNMAPILKKIEEDKLMKKNQAIQEREQSLQQEMQAYSQELNKPILERVQKAVEIVAERKKVNYVIDESVTLYFKGGIDLTAEVLSELLRLDAEATKN